jgi:hypothetical protein
VLFGEGDTSMPLDQHSCSSHKAGKTPCELLGGARPELTGGKSCCGDDDDELFDGGFDEDDLPGRDYDSESLPFVVICPTCSEAFIPSFPGGCRHCRYVWDKSKPLDSEEAVEAHKTKHKAPNPALQESGGVSLLQLIVIGAVVMTVLILLGALMMQ